MLAQRIQLGGFFLSVGQFNSIYFFTNGLKQPNGYFFRFVIRWFNLSVGQINSIFFPQRIETTQRINFQISKNKFPIIFKLKIPKQQIVWNSGIGSCDLFGN